MRPSLVCLTGPEPLAAIRAVIEEDCQLEMELSGERSTDLLVVDEEALRRVGASVVQLRDRGLLGSVLLIATPEAAANWTCTGSGVVFDDFVAPAASHAELAARVRLQILRARPAEPPVETLLTPQQQVSERSFRALAETSPDVVARYDRDLRYLYVNSASTRATGMSPEAMVGRTHRELGFESELTNFWDETIRQGFRTGEAARVEYTYATPQGLRFFESRLAPERAPDGTIASVLVISRDMTDRALAEAAVRISEARLAESMTLVRSGSWVFDPETDTATWSKEMFRLLGYAPEQTVPPLQEFLTRVHPDDRDALRALIQLTRQGENTRSLEFRLLLPGGLTRHLLAHAHTSWSPRTHRPHVVGAITDITERKFREMERESERSLLEMVARGAALDECLEHMAGTLQGLFPNTLWSVSVTASDDTLQLVAGMHEHPHVRAALASFPIGADAGPCGRAAYLRRPIVADDLLSSQAWQEYRELADALSVKSCVTVPIFSSQKQVLGTFAMYLREARGPTPAESRCLERAASLAGFAIERDRYHGALAESEALLRMVFDNSPIGIYLCDAHGRVVYMNPAVHSLLGTERSQLLGRRWFRYLHPDEKRVVAESLRGLLKGERRSLDLAWRQLTPTGETKTLQVHASTIAGAKQGSGARRGFVGTVEDITARLRLEEQLRHSQKMEAVGQLAGGVAHDFNNLLTVVLNGVSLLDPQRSGKDRNLLRQVELAAERAAELTKQLLAFGRRQRMSSQVVDLNDLVANLCEMLRRLIGEQNVLEAELAPEGAPALVDANMVEQILLNLVVNARDAMPRGGKIALRLSAVPREHAALVQRGAGKQEYLCLSVADTGVGIAKEDLSRVFEPFYTTKEPGKGTGLGLATVYAIVEQHGGFIEVDSRVGGGTSVSVYLPRATTPARRTVAPSSSAPRGRETLLLAEDEPAVREMVRTSLESCGYRVLEAINGDEALEIWRAHSSEISLLITDMVMPGTLLGGELAQRLRAERPELRVVYMSGYGGQDLWLDELSRFVPKPFQVSTLGQLVRECLDAGAEAEDSPLPRARAELRARTLRHRAS